MDYEKKYKEDNDKVAARFGTNVAKEIFTDLYESEDEKIRKWLIEYFHQHKEDGMEKYANGLKVESIIAWLEKQNSNADNANKEYWRGYREGKQEILDKYAELEKQGEKINPYSGASFEYNGHIWGMCARDYGVDILLDKQFFKHLEEQDKQKPIIEMKSLEESIGIPSKEYNEIVNECLYGESKSDDKVEPKFKVGDWVVNENGTVQQILSYKNGIYKHTNGYSSKMFEDEWRLWDITKDAKDGDVLVHNDCTFIFMGFEGSIVKALEEALLDGTTPVPFGEIDKDNAYNYDYHPAIEEQRDILFEKIKEAGYEWDAENKQLKKISQRMISAEAKEAMYDKPTDLEKLIIELSKQFPNVSFGKLSRIAVRVAKWAKPTDEEMKELLRTEYEKGRADAIAEMQKSTWSEEDEYLLHETIQHLEELIRIDKAKHCACDVQYYQRDIDWLKSLKERCTWKPSEGQLDALKRTQTGVIQFSVLQSLYNDLKKL